MHKVLVNLRQRKLINIRDYRPNRHTCAKYQGTYNQCPNGQKICFSSLGLQLHLYAYEEQSELQ